MIAFYLDNAGLSLKNQCNGFEAKIVFKTHLSWVFQVAGSSIKNEAGDEVSGLAESDSEFKSDDALCNSWSLASLSKLKFVPELVAVTVTVDWWPSSVSIEGSCAVSVFDTLKKLSILFTFSNTLSLSASFFAALYLNALPLGLLFISKQNTKYKLNKHKTQFTIHL